MHKFHKIAILGAMKEEIEPILEKIENIKYSNYADNIFYEGQINGKEVVLAHSKVGKVFASLSATTLIEKYGCDILLFIGVAGGVNSDLRIGDFVIAKKLCQHDVDISVFGHPFGYISESEVFIETNEELRDIGASIALEKDFKFIEGTIATGDQFIADNDKKEWIKETFNADCIEMEGASVAVVCKSLGIPFFIIRSISDSADTDASFNFQEFLNFSASRSADFIVEFIKKLT